MNEDKQVILDQLLERINKSPFLIVTDYTGIKVSQFAELRKRLRGVGSTCQVAKNTFVKRVLKDGESVNELASSLNGQTAIVTGEEDICAAAKVLKDFAKEFQGKGAVKSGLLDGKFLSPAQVQTLADLPSKDVLRATLLGVLLAPASKLVRTLNEPAASLARVLQAKADKG